MECIYLFEIFWLRSLYVSVNQTANSWLECHSVNWDRLTNAPKPGVFYNPNEDGIKTCVGILSESHFWLNSSGNYGAKWTKWKPHLVPSEDPLKLGQFDWWRIIFTHRETERCITVTQVKKMVKTQVLKLLSVFVIYWNHYQILFFHSSPSLLTPEKGFFWHLNKLLYSD